MAVPRRSVGIVVLTQVSIIVVGAVMLWTGLLMGLAMLPYKEMMLKWRGERAQTGLERIWWALVIWVGLAGWILFRQGFGVRLQDQIIGAVGELPLT